MKSTFILLLLTTFTTTLFCQEEMPIKKDSANVQITFAFNDLKGKRALEGPKELCLFITNNNEYDVKISFSLAFFSEGLVNEESAELKLCAQAGKVLKGKKFGLCWLITEENNQKILDESFDWEINSLKIEKTSSCK